MQQVRRGKERQRGREEEKRRRREVEKRREEGRNTVYPRHLEIHEYDLKWRERSGREGRIPFFLLLPTLSYQDIKGLISVVGNEIRDLASAQNSRKYELVQLVIFYNQNAEGNGRSIDFVGIIININIVVCKCIYIRRQF